MFSCFCKKKNQEDIPSNIPHIEEGLLNNAMWNRRPLQTSVIGVDPANPQGQTPGNPIIAGPSAPADPAQVSSTPSTSSTSVIGLDSANPQGQAPGNSIPSAPADPAEVSSSPSTSSTSVIGVDPANPQGQTPGNSIIARPSAPADPAEVLSSPFTSSTSVIGVDPANPQRQTPGNSIIAGPSAPADPAEVSSSPSTSSTSAQALPQAGGRSRISSSISIGQDQAFDEVCKFLTEDDVGIVGIYGMGGVGKTTLTKKVWYEFLGPNNFKVLSIVVSKIVNVDRIQEDIMKKMDLPFEKDADKRAREINKAIASSRRKLALLFDDIWEALDLDEIGVLGEMILDTTIFKIIFTTRLEDVCSQMQPDGMIKIQPLGWDDSWALFAKNVGTKTLHSSRDEILDLAKSVAEECKGLPLALIVIGRAMTSKYSREAWEDAFYNLRKSLAKVQGSEERLFSILKLSYDNIQNDVEKECFLFCCLYPEDWRIDRRELVEFWIGDGILDLDGSYHDTCNRGYAIIDRLLAACLLEFKGEDCLTMYDIIRDMGLWIAGGLKFFVHAERLELTKDEIRNRWEEANGMYILKVDDLPEQPHCQNLSTLIFDIKRPMIPKLQNSFLQFMDKLRILKMHNLTFLDTTFEIVGQFTELRWLSICGTNLEKFPSELGNLRKLNVLEIEFLEQVDSLPPAIGQLRELRKLWITSPTVINMLPLELGKLSKLEELVLRGGGKGCSATRIHQAHQTTIVGHVDPANPQGQTPGNSIIARPSAPADPAEVSSSPFTSSTSVIEVDPANPKGQTPGNSIIAGPSAPSTSSISAQVLPQAGGRSRISSSISIGQDQAFDEVCKFLTEDDVGIVGIYGMGGIGKTTLMKKVWYEFLKPSNFKVLSIVVSKIVNIDRIQKDIMIEMDLLFEKDEHPHRRARDINKAIASSRRKLALLFDDIWEALDLYEIGILGEMSFDTSIFKIIFTTRLEDACSQMQPDRKIKIQPLGWDDSWALFAKHVGTRTLHSSHNEILDLAKSVAKECKGLPLALSIVGKAMTCKYSREAWVDALYNLQKPPSKFQRFEERLFSILKMSYDSIQNDVEKECFLFCCLYPEDWRIDRQELVEFWIGDGILDLDDSYHDTRNRGYAIIGRLLAACLLELEGDLLTMHNIIRNMGLWIAGESKFFIHGERLELTKDEIRNRWEKANGMYVLEGDDLPKQPHCRYLSTLIFDDCRLRRLELQNSFLLFMDKLRILKMNHLTFLDTTFVIVGQFTELRWLSICGTNLEKFPSELGNLGKLNVLQVEFERTLDSLPPAIGQLRELRKLWITSPTAITMLPLELGKLSKLEELLLPTRAYKNCLLNLIPNGIFDHMHKLRRLELTVTSVGILPADLWNLSKLEHLLIEASGLVAGRDGEDMDIFDMYKCPPGLNWDSVGVTLSIDGLKQLSKSLKILDMIRWPIFKWADIGSTLETMNEMSELSIEEFLVDEIIVSSKRLDKLDILRCPLLVKLQVGGDALKCLCSLTIRYCVSLKHIIGLEHLEHLKDLDIDDCRKLEGELLNPNEGISSLPLCFPHLQSLRLYDLPLVTAICSDHVSFPSLLHLNVSQCQKLEKFPRGLMNEKRPLQGEIEGTKEWWEGLQWQDEGFKSYLLPLLEDLSE